MIAMQRIQTLKVENIGGGWLRGQSWVFFQPMDWHQVEPSNEFLRFFHNKTGARFAASAALFDDGLVWIHGSVSRADRVATYEDLCELKQAVFGDNGYAAMVFPPKRFHVNIHPNALHLWGPLNPAEWPIPEFSLGGGSI